MESRPAPKPELSPDVQPASAPRGEFVTRDGELYYRIAAYHRLDPFLMTLASDTDLWMFVASGGGLTAGRVDPDGSLFPYRTVDQLHEAHHHTGPLTVLRIEQPDGEPLLWEPFREFEPRQDDVERNLYKNTVGNRLVFEEARPDLGLTFSYGWGPSEDFGWVRTATLTNTTDAPARVSLLDGLRNVLPFGAPLGLHQQASNLVDAYKKSEADPESGLGIFSLTAGITDRAEALESLQASVVWCCGLEGRRIHLSTAAVAAFRKGRVMTEDAVLNGVRGNYLVSSELDLAAGQTVTWHLVADTGCDHAQVVGLRRRLLDGTDLAAQITASLDRSTANLRAIVADADGLQLSGHPEGWSHHFANVLFNNMRGGVFDRNNDVPVADFIDFLAVRNRAVAERWGERLQDLPETVPVAELRTLGRDSGDADFARLCHEYLPLYFGRRHGDPSRPWNRFAIRVRSRTGARELNYQGNWRDIFQNWEALSLAFPDFLPSLVAKFVNASTIDGFNPYRITREGIDWETQSPDDPWSNIGYWGDHQIIYLLRLLEAWNDHDPEGLDDMLGEAIYSYADVPYRLKPYAQILQSPDDTIDFDTTRAAEVDGRVAGLGSDGKLLPDGRGGLQHANLLEKLLVPALSKLSNLVPGGGIWMNTQRPEWNDANNALAGGGISVVTLCYLRRYLNFLADLLDRSDNQNLDVATEVGAWFEAISSTLSAGRGESARETLTAQDRKQTMDALGGAFETYREAVYDRGFTGRSPLSLRQVGDFCRHALRHVDESIAANRRSDGLYHTYNVLHLSEDGTGAEILRLQEMLEGQVAVLSAGVLQPAEALQVLEQLYASGMYRPDQDSFLLYPQRGRPGFLEKNRIPAERIETVPLLRALVTRGDGALLTRDVDGDYHFHGDIRCARDLEAVLDEIGADEAWSTAVDRDRSAVLDLFEDIFKHKSFTGRSGTMYGYEGQGCIYWHMVAKLLLAVQEVLLDADPDTLTPNLRFELSRMYFRVRAGIGYEKSVGDYGAFPTDPYSHTPAGGGAKQPGMTGQVKEEIITRRGELGVTVRDGVVSFRPTLLRAAEFTRQPAEFAHVDVAGRTRTLPLRTGSLAFTLCQVPVIYELVDEQESDGAATVVHFTDGSTVAVPDRRLDAALSADLFARNGRIGWIRVGVVVGAVS